MSSVRNFPVIQSFESVDVRVFGGPTTLIEIGGLRLLTDPTFDDVRDYELGPGLVLSKTLPSPISADEIGAVDAVLLSHDQHPDNLDVAGRAYLGQAPKVSRLPTPRGTSVDPHVGCGRGRAPCGPVPRRLGAHRDRDPGAAWS